MKKEYNTTIVERKDESDMTIDDIVLVQNAIDEHLLVSKSGLLQIIAPKPEIAQVKMTAHFNDRSASLDLYDVKASTSIPIGQIIKIAPQGLGDLRSLRIAYYTEAQQRLLQQESIKSYVAMLSIEKAPHLHTQLSTPDSGLQRKLLELNGATFKAYVDDRHLRA